MLRTYMHVLLYILFNISCDPTTNSVTVIPFLSYVASFSKQNQCPHSKKKKEKQMWMNIKDTALLF